ncbi:FG-GAP repeat protein [Planomonospora venezuelensis]|uniref:FG-GAP repeat-containing protein n=1 Tax=Planomonospora venezuelensis TaxID=1999 RepID=A0A841D2S6_PLAVE|nr:FG-GAP repeat protein [Planomonospora venezuelensis]MBB5962698.1 hypothetical protein [Planomonospora venezuelensis]GIN01633.1 hypothetical protein Pve01_32910 [Planomonospora venezuelensis]
MRFLLSLLLAAALPVLPAGAPVPGSAVPVAAAPDPCASAGESDFDGDGVDDAVVGDPFADVAGADGAETVNGAGAVHVLSGRSGEGAVVTAPGPAAGDGFGWSVRLVHIDGDRCADLLVGAPYADLPAGEDAGAAYVVYGGTPRDPVRLTAAEPEADAHFGWSLAARGPLVAVGAPHENVDGVADSGAAHLFETSALDRPWKISQSTDGVTGNSEVGDMFGWAVELGRLGGTAGELDLAIGLPYENDDGTGVQAGEGKLDSGAIGVLFDVRKNRGKQVSKKWDLREITEADAGDRFGYALAYGEDGDTSYLAVGAPLGDGESVKDSGVVQLFQASSTAEITPGPTFGQGREGVAGDGYGFAVAFSEGGELRLVVGVPFRGPDQRGSVSLFPVGGGSGRARVVDGTGPGERFGWSVAASGNKIVAGAPDRGTSGGVTLLGRNDGAATPAAPGAGKVPALDRGGSADFGSATG